MTHRFLLTGLAFLLDGRNDPPGGSSGADNILVGNGQEVSLLVGKF